MKKLFSVLVVLMLIPFFASAEEVTAEDVVSILEQSFSEWDYCKVRYDSSDDSLFVDLAIDGFSQSVYLAIENGFDSISEEWNQLKGMFLAIYCTIESFFEVAEIETPDHILLQLWNDDVVIRDDQSLGKSRVFLAIHNGLFYIDEMEIYSEIEISETKSAPVQTNESTYILN